MEANMFRCAFVLCLVIGCVITTSPIPPNALEELNDRELVLLMVQQSERQQMQIDELKRALQEETKVVSDLKAELQQINEKAVRDNGHEKNSETAFRRFRRAGGVIEAAFTATAVDSIANLANYQVIKFDNVSLNLGNHYNIDDGTFTAPVAGIYVLSASITAELNVEMLCVIDINGQLQATIYAHAADNFHDQGSQTVVAHMNQGDKASVQNMSKNGQAFGLSLSNFSGFLLYPDHGDPAVIG